MQQPLQQSSWLCCNKALASISSWLCINRMHGVTTASRRPVTNSDSPADVRGGAGRLKLNEREENMFRRRELEQAADLHEASRQVCVKRESGGEGE